MTSSTRHRTGEIPAPARRGLGLVPTGRLGDARTPWNDYRGTAAADDATALLGSRSLYEIADLDRSRWTIVGIDASLLAQGEEVVVYAVDRTVEPDQREGAATELAVTAFHLSPSTRVDQFLQEAFQRVSVRLVSTLATDHALRVESHVEVLPEQ